MKNFANKNLHDGKIIDIIQGTTNIVDAIEMSYNCGYQDGLKSEDIIEMSYNQGYRDGLYSNDEIIFFDWHRGDDYNKSFGQITFCNGEGEKQDVVNIDNIKEKVFKAIFEIIALSSSQKTVYGYL